LKKKTELWIKQADYDIDTALFMIKGGRYFYSVFMSHLSIEKALKGLYFEKLNTIPPKTHNLIALLQKINIAPPEDTGKFIVKINTASVDTRYPENIEILESQYTKDVAADIYNESIKVLEWIKNLL